MRFRKTAIVSLMLLSMFGVTACTNSSGSSSSETKTVVPVKQNTDNVPSYNKEFRISISNDVSPSDNNKVINRANTWVAKQDLKEYSPHFMMYVDPEAGNANYLCENVTMVKRPD